MLLRTNLSTRPFYNERVISISLIAVAALVAAATAFNVVRVVELSQRQSVLGGEIASNDAQVRQFQQESESIRASIDEAELQAVIDRTTEANLIVGERVFSWTEFFNRIESTIPADVMLLAVRPAVADGASTISMTLLGKNVESIDTFMERLEATATFEGLLSREEQITDEGMYRAVVEGRYVAREPQADAATKTPGVARR